MTQRCSTRCHSPRKAHSKNEAHNHSYKPIISCSPSPASKRSNKPNAGDMIVMLTTKQVMKPWKQSPQLIGSESSKQWLFSIQIAVLSSRRCCGRGNIIDGHMSSSFKQRGFCYSRSIAGFISCHHCSKVRLGILIYGERSAVPVCGWWTFAGAEGGAWR